MVTVVTETCCRRIIIYINVFAFVGFAVQVNNICFTVLLFLDCLTLEEWTDRCPETSVPNYKSTPSHIPEERRSHLHDSGSLKSRTCTCSFELKGTGPFDKIFECRTRSLEC